MVAHAHVPRAPHRRVATLLIDNYDSYTYNIYQMLAQVNGVAPIVVRNDDFHGDWHAAWRAFERQARQQQCGASTAYVSKSSASAADSSSTDSSSSADEDDDHVASINDDDSVVFNVVLSPGPGHPGVATDFGMCADAIRFAQVPVLGVCLGHQGLAHVYGGRVVNAPEVMHGRTSEVFFSAADSKAPSLFAHVPDGFEVVRYHSLVADEASLPAELRVTARTADGVVMALEHASKPQFGVQFHPEAVCSSFGYQLFQNFRDITLAQPASQCLLQHSSLEPHVLERPAVVDAVVRPVAPASQETAYSVQVHVAARGLASLAFAETVFTELYADSERSFWLDSSNFDSAATSPAARSTSRFSLMGDSSGPLSYTVEYCILENLLRVYEARDGETIVSEERGSDILTHLRAKMAALRAHDVEVVDDDLTSNDSDQLPFAFRGGFVGYFGYEVLGSGVQDADGALSGAEAIRRAMAQRLAARDYVPDASFVFADRTLVFDHRESIVYAVSVSRKTPLDLAATAQWHVVIAAQLAALQRLFQASPDALAPGSDRAAAARHAAAPSDGVVFRPSRSKAQYGRDIATIQQLIHDGETYEVCLTNQLDASYAMDDPLAFYQLLRKRNPAPYAGLYLVNPRGVFDTSRTSASTTRSASLRSQSPLLSGMTESYAICCSSPERFLRVGSDGWMESKPIKGTRRRGATPAEDAAIAQELASCVKDRAENMMIADLVRNDFGVVAQIGSVHVPTLMAVETYATVHQLVTTVRGQRRDDADVVDILHATFPGGSMTGAPKKRTMEVIRQLELAPRSVYSGALGFLSLDGSCDLNIVIRTAVVTPTRVSLGAGGAIIALSDTDEEYDEMLLKTRALVHALGAFATGRDDGARVDAGN